MLFQPNETTPHHTVTPHDVGAQLQLQTFGVPPPFVGLILICPNPVISIAWIGTGRSIEGRLHTTLAALCKHEDENQKRRLVFSIIIKAFNRFKNLV